MAVNPNKVLWEKGDFTQIAATMREAGEALANSLNVENHHHVLDLGCGDGTTAIPFARRAGKVIGIDIARNLVAAGNARAATLGLANLSFQEGDACKLDGVADNSFDLSVSIFGAMFAPKPFDVAKELVRVTKKGGGRIVMGNWIPNDPTSFVSQLLKISASFLPPPAADAPPSPMTWGVEDNIIERFGKAGIAKEQIVLVKDIFHFSAPDKTPSEFMDIFRQWYGPTMNAYDAAGKNGKTEELRTQLNELAERFNTNKTNGTQISATFMRVTVNL